MASIASGGQPEPGEELAGGATTVFDATANAFSLPARNLSSARRRAFAVGNSFFNDNWVTAPSSTEGRDGLGPLLNARSCSSCHEKDGRGAPRVDEEGDRFLSPLIRLSIPGVGEDGGPVPEPNYGGQLNNRSIAGVPAEGRIHILDRMVRGEFADGSAYYLQKPRYVFAELQYGPLHEDFMFSPRVAPAIHGLGLLEAIPEAAILSLADPDDSDGDGVSGRPNYVWDIRKGGKSLGRFGWKANQPTLEQQAAGAFLGDIGITSSLFPNQNATAVQQAARETPGGGEPELDDAKLERVSFYVHTLGVPARRGSEDPQVVRGKELFAEARCDSCHAPRWKTGELAGFAELSNQIIWPYTDLLLHDMGEDLADGRPDFEADGSEWRTPPLWGIGLFDAVNGHTRLLHDGRARSISGAILWHGGEAEASREAYRGMPVEDRAALISFLESL